VTVNVQDRFYTFQAPSGEPGTDTQTAAAVLPILLHDREVGSIRVLTAPDRLLGASEQRLLALLARQAALVVERARLAMQAAAARALEQADRLKSSLLSSVSHDLRTPLVAIIGSATALRSDDVPLNSAEGKQMLDAIITEAERLNRLVGNLLNMSRIESGALQVTRAWDDIGNILGGVLARMRPQLRNRPVRVTIPPETPMVWVNAALIDQVLTNLLDNAIKYTAEQTPIQFAIDVHDTELLVRVIDDGPGIPADALPYIFDKFFRVIGPERHADGTGLGLAICKGIVEAHGGHIWATNRPQGGTEFVFTVPLSPAPGDQMALQPFNTGNSNE
jgi:two-component system sensor histidine kinase KdpD